MLVEKEVIAPGTYWYIDEKSGTPRKLDVSSELTKYWHEQGGKMLSAGLSVPVPFEHDFSIHPMTPKDKLLNNAGWVAEYRLKDFDDPKRGRVKDALFAVVDVQDEEIAKKLPRTVRWTSPWINTFTDGSGHEWKNVISHLALTTRPRVTKQSPFPSIAAALSLATTTVVKVDTPVVEGMCLSRAGTLIQDKGKRLRPCYPVAFSMWAGGVKLAEGDMPFKKKGSSEKDDTGDSEPDTGSDSGKSGGDSSSEGSKTKEPPSKNMDGDGGEGGEGGGSGEESSFPPSDNPLGDSQGDVKMEELLCDLLNALGVYMPENVGEGQFKRALYEATMMKIKELTAKAQAAADPNHPMNPANAANAAANTTSPANPNTQPNPLIQQEQQPMYMSLEEIHKLPDPMKGLALAMYNENVKLRSEVDANAKVANSLRDAKLKEATTARAGRVAILAKVSPRVKTDLEAMLALPAMALSMGEGGAVTDPMAQTLTMLEKGLSDIPRLLTTEAGALSVHPQPTDSEMTEEAEDALADSLARQMGCPPQKKAS